MIRLALFAGPSGGHLFPAVAFAEAFRGKFPESRLWLVTGERARDFSAQLENKFFDSVVFLPDFPFSPGISLRTLRFLLQLAQAFIRSSRCLSEIQPDLCVGFGSYIAYPGLRIASQRKIPVLIHEQNQIPGKATRWLIPHADAVTVT
ncbi:MAG TPA: UDP-N-acetylglucosamine--N-acetylmuramyl-(pentapeptide) pyrophosphoryl-undecaprenol N-acetylglucosamine transferase, partial [bacterium]|nr:UDP-N-acetylglucosamine--N-acetylmuramyl-(pentapeptide) pyrophosphoryl-undecaprenol N-acetylglucosamine transferase [bacterium]